MSSANKPRAYLNAKYWCQVIPDTVDFRNLRNEIRQGLAWSKKVANIRAQPRDPPPLSNQDQEIFQHLVKRHCLNPSQVFAVCQILDKSCITALTEGAGIGKLETPVACTKAVLWQLGYIVTQNPDPADLSTIN